MKKIDRILQTWRIKKALKHISVGSRVLDIGCFNGELFLHDVNRFGSGVGIDPLLPKAKVISENIKLISGLFPGDLHPAEKKFDAIVLLAVFEHIPETALDDFVVACFEWLNENGKAILTVPSPFVDKILAALSKLRLIDGMSLEEHHGLPIECIIGLFAKHNFKLQKYSTFQLGLNNLFVFTKE